MRRPSRPVFVLAAAVLVCGGCGAPVGRDGVAPDLGPAVVLDGAGDTPATPPTSSLASTAPGTQGGAAPVEPHTPAPAGDDDDGGDDAGDDPGPGEVDE